MKQSIRLIALCLLCVAASKPQWIFDGTTWTCEQTQVFESSRIKGLSKFFEGSAPLLELSLGEDTWTLSRDGQPWTSGSWSRKSPTKRSLKLSLGADATSAMERSVAHHITQEATMHGVDGPVVDATLAKSKLTFRLKLEKQAGTVSGVLKAKLRIAGTLSGTLNGQPFTRPWKTSVRFKGRSGSVPADDVSQPGDLDTTPPVAKINVGQSTGDAPFSAQFASAGTGDVTTWAWDFGDGSASVQANPVHTYTDPGVFGVSLTVAGPYGTDTATRFMTVTGQPTTLLKLYPVTAGVPGMPGQLVEQPVGGGGVALQRPIPGGGNVASRIVFERLVGDMEGALSTTYEIHLAAAATLNSGELGEMLLETCVVLRRTGPEPDVIQFLVEPVVYPISIPPEPFGGPAPPNNINLVTLGPMIDAAPEDVLELHILNVSPESSEPSDDDLLMLRLDSACIYVPLRPAGG
jgi:PKD repeat protein